MSLTKRSSSHSTGSLETTAGRVKKVGDRYMYKENISPYYKGLISLTEKVPGKSYEVESKNSTRHDLGWLSSPYYQGLLNTEKEVPGKASSSHPLKKPRVTGLLKETLVKSPLALVDSDVENTGISKPRNLDRQARVAPLFLLTRRDCQSVTPDEDRENTGRGKAIADDTWKTRVHTKDNELNPTSPEVKYVPGWKVHHKDNIKISHLKELRKSIIKKRKEASQMLADFDMRSRREWEEMFEKYLLLEAAVCGLENRERKLEHEQKNFSIERENFVVLEKKWESEKESLVSAVENLHKHNRALNHRLKEVSMDRQWLIEKGLLHVVKYLHRSEEFLKPLGELHLKLLKSELHEGVQAGYRFCNKGVPIERTILYRPHAEEGFKAAVLELAESIKFPYLEALSACVNQPLSVLQSLQPRGLQKDKVGLDVAETADPILG